MRLLRLVGASLLVSVVLLSVGIMPQPVLADDVLVDGTSPYTCDQHGLAMAIIEARDGSTITFACDDPLIEFAGGEMINIAAGYSITIDGSNGGNQIVLDGNDVSRFFRIAEGGTLVLQHLTLQHGSALSSLGGAIVNRGDLTITQSSFVSNEAIFGGSVASNGTLIISQSSFTTNSATTDGGAIRNEPNGTVTITQSSFTSNTARNGGGAISSRGTLVIGQSSFTSNSADYGGAVGVAEDTMATVVASTLTGNLANESGSTFYQGEVDMATIAWSTIVQPEGTTPALYLEGDLTLEGVILGGDGEHCTLNGGEAIATSTLTNDDSCDPTQAAEWENQELLLGPLATAMIDGIEQTYYPLYDGSPAIDAGLATCDIDVFEGPDPDQLGNPRPVNNLCDIGAVEGVIIATTDLCANSWNGALRVSEECSRGETQISLPMDGPITVCVNQWNGSASLSQNCGRGEEVVTIVGDQTMAVCVNQWTGALRVSDECSRNERGELI